MPLTPFHFGPSACIALPLKRYIDVPVFILANVAIDIEPLIVMNFHLSYPLHGMAHTFAGAAVIGICLGLIANWNKTHIQRLMEKMLRLQYAASLKKYILSGILGCWLHVLLDSPLYTDIKPFSPFSDLNPLFGAVQGSMVYKVCAYAFIPAIFFYILFVIWESKRSAG